jgi:PAS domain S-box-containing protein
MAKESRLEALRQSDRLFRLLVQGLTDHAIFMLDSDGHIRNWNSGAQHIKGYTAEEIIGQHFSRFYTAEDLETGVPSKPRCAQAGTRRKAGGSEKMNPGFGRVLSWSRSATTPAPTSGSPRSSVT